jgi:hypothetical protein
MWRHAVTYTGQPGRDDRAGVVVIAPLLTALSGVAAQGLLDDMLAELSRVSAANPALVYGVAGLFGVSLLLGLVSLTSGLILRRSVRAGAAEHPAVDLIAPPPAPTPPAPEVVPAQPIEATISEPLPDVWEDRSEEETSIGERAVAADQEQPEAPFAPTQPIEAAIAEPLPDVWEDRSEEETSIGERTVAADQEQPEAPFAPTQPIEAAIAEPVTEDTRPTPVSMETPPVGPPVPQPIISDEEPTAWDDEAVETAHLKTDELEEADTELLAAVEAAQIYLIGLDQPSLRFTLEPGGGRLGSAPECECIIEVPAVSPYHAAIWRSGQTWLVRDLGSSDGTFVNDERVTGDCPLQDGDVLRVGSARLSIKF